VKITHQNGRKLRPFLISAATVGAVVLHPSVEERYDSVTTTMTVVSFDTPTVLSVVFRDAFEFTPFDANSVFFDVVGKQMGTFPESFNFGCSELGFYTRLIDEPVPSS
jgi:hypothetical protein